MQRREPLERRRPVGVEDRPTRRRARPGRAGCRPSARPSTVDPAARGRRAWPPAAGRRTTTGSSAPCSTDSSRKPGSSPDAAGERGDRGDQVGEQLAPDRHDRVRRPPAPGTPSRRRLGATLRPAEGAEEAAALAGVAGALALLLDDEQQRRRRRSRSRPRGSTGGRPRCRPCTSTPGGSGSRTRCGPSRATRAASPRSSTPSSAPRPVPASCTMAGTSPSAL